MEHFLFEKEIEELRQKLDIVTQIDGFTGVEIVFPYETGDAEETKKLMADRNLEFAAVNVNVKKEAEFVPGSMSRADKGIRERAVQMIKNAKDYAKAVGAPHVTCCPLSDGYDVLFQIDYRTAWRNLVDTFGEAADYLPEIQKSRNQSS